MDAENYTCIVVSTLASCRGVKC